MYSDSYLNSLWREAVLLKYYNSCALCGSVGPLQAHHIIYRRKAYLKHDPKNGVALCKACHLIAHTKAGEERIKKIIGDDWFYLVEFEQVILKDWLVSKGMSRAEFSAMRVKELKEIIMEI